MKKSIYFSGITCANLLMFGCMFKIQHWPGANVLLTLSIALFCFYFLPAALVSSYQEQETKKYKLLYIVTFIVFFIGMLGILFKTMHWPGASVFLFLGIILPFILFLPVYLYQTRNERKNENLHFMSIMFGLTFLAVFSVLLSLNVSRNVLNQLSRNISFNEQASQFNANDKNISPENAIKKQSDDLCAYIDNLKCELLTATGNSCEVLKTSNTPPVIVNEENQNVPRHILYGNGENNKMNELKAKMNAYRESLNTTGKVNSNLTELINDLFDVSNNNINNGEVVTWEDREFSSLQLIVVLNVLTRIQSNVRLVELEVLAMK